MGFILLHQKVASWSSFTGSSLHFLWGELPLTKLCQCVISSKQRQTHKLQTKPSFAIASAMAKTVEQTKSLKKCMLEKR